MILEQKTLETPAGALLDFKNVQHTGSHQKFFHVQRNNQDFWITEQI